MKVEKIEEEFKTAKKIFKALIARIERLEQKVKELEDNSLSQRLSEVRSRDNREMAK